MPLGYPGYHTLSLNKAPRVNKLQLDDSKRAPAYTKQGVSFSDLGFRYATPETVPKLNSK